MEECGPAVIKCDNRFEYELAHPIETVSVFYSAENMSFQ